MRLRNGMLACAVASVLGMGTMAQAAVIITSVEDASISATDSLQGLTASMSTGFGAGSAALGELTDGTVTTGGVYGSDNGPTTYTFNLGDANAAIRRLDNASITTYGRSGDNGRDAFKVELFTSLNGVNYTAIPGTEVTRAKQSTATMWRDVDYTFGLTDVVGFQYLQFKITPQSASNGADRHPRIVEFDANVTVPEPASMGVAALGVLALSGRRRRA